MLRILVPTRRRGNAVWTRLRPVAVTSPGRRRVETKGTRRRVGTRTRMRNISYYDKHKKFFEKKTISCLSF